LFIILFAGSPALAQEELAFTGTTFVTGFIWSEISTSSFSMQRSVHDGMREVNKTDITQNLTVEKTQTIIETLANGKIAKLKVSYGAVSVNGVSNPVSGTIYILSSKSGRKVDTVTYEDGGTPIEGEVSFVKEDNSNLDKLAVLNKFLAGQTVKVGDSPKISPQLADEIVNLEDKVKVTELTLVLTDIINEGLPGEPSKAVFNVTMNFENKLKEKGSEPGAKFQGGMTFEMTGTMSFYSDSRPIEVSLSGPVNLSGRLKEIPGKPTGPEQVPPVPKVDRHMDVSGSGSSQLTVLYSYQE
jgi:hypothetical protein